MTTVELLSKLNAYRDRMPKASPLEKMRIAEAASILMLDLLVAVVEENRKLLERVERLEGRGL